jgi:hypothetical protein
MALSPKNPTQEIKVLSIMMQLECQTDELSYKDCQGWFVLKGPSRTGPIQKQPNSLIDMFFTGRFLEHKYIFTKFRSVPKSGILLVPNKNAEKCGVVPMVNRAIISEVVQ